MSWDKEEFTTQPRTFKIRKDSPGPESCQYSEYETLNNYIQFKNPGVSSNMRTICLILRSIMKSQYITL